MLSLALRKYTRFLLPANEPFSNAPQVLSFCSCPRIKGMTDGPPQRGCYGRGGYPDVT